MQRAIFLIFSILCTCIEARLLVAIDEQASFTPQDFARSAQATLVEVERRNPCKALYQVFEQERFVVLAPTINDEGSAIFDDTSMRLLGKTYGYRAVYFSQETLEEAVEIARKLLLDCPQYTSDLEPVEIQESKDLYALAGKIDQVLTKYQVHYWAGRETLLGIVQCEGLRSWDDYLHFFIFDFDEEKLKNLIEEFRAVGLELHHYFKDFYKLYALDGKILEDKYHPGQIQPFRYPAANIFVMALEKRNEAEDVYVQRSEHFYKYWNFDRFYYEQIKTLTRATFGPITLPIPQDPESYLDRVFGRPGYPHLWRKYVQEKMFDHRIEYKSLYPGAAFVEIDTIQVAPW